MKKLFFVSILASFLPLSLMAQDDDLYFTAKKSAETTDTYPKTDNKNAYYVGSKRDVDEYNRHGKSWSLYQKVGEDGKGNDIIQFQKGNGVYPDSTYIDTTFVGKYYDTIVDDDDYAYTRRMSRWDGYYGWYSPWYYSSWGYGPWYGAYGPWRSAWGWYDPWYSSYYYGGWGWYDPWYYGGMYAGWGYPYRGYWGYWDYPGYRGVYAVDRPSNGVRNYSFPNHGGATASSRNGVRTYSRNNASGRAISPNRSSSNSNFGQRSFGSRSYTPRMDSGMSRGGGSFSGGGSFGGGARSGGGSFSGGGNFGGGNFGGGGHFGHR